MVRITSVKCVRYAEEKELQPQMITARLPANKRKLYFIYLLSLFFFYDTVIRFKKLRAKRCVLSVFFLVEEIQATDLKHRSILYHMSCFVRLKYTEPN